MLFAPHGFLVAGLCILVVGMGYFFKVAHNAEIVHVALGRAADVEPQLNRKKAMLGIGIIAIGIILILAPAFSM